jgi:DNA-binding NtrC family response regulator
MSPESQHNVVILESNQVRRDYLISIISGWGYAPFSFDKETICLDNLSRLNAGLVISGNLSLEKTFRFVNTLKIRNHGLPILIISEDYAIQDFIETNLHGDIFVISTPIDSSKIKKAIRDIQSNRLKKKVSKDCPLIIGNSPEMIKIKKIISELNASKETVMIQGETGTGKDLVARAIHFTSDRRNNPFIKVDIASLSHKFFENEPFEYNPATLSHAYKNLKTMFKTANAGTVFLDHIEKAPAFIQAELLRILDAENIWKLCTDQEVTADVRLIVSTSIDLSRLVEKERFRKDLFYRLNVIGIEIPPLRYRAQDIPMLAVFFNDKFCEDLGKSHYDLAEKTKNRLKNYHWPGNVRELENVVRHSVLLGNEYRMLDQIHKSNDFINYSEYIYNIPELSDVKKYLKNLSKISLKDICREYITRTEKKVMKQALNKTNWNRKKAAILLDISYKSLLNKIKAYDLV